MAEAMMIVCEGVVVSFFIVFLVHLLVKIF